jgi:hypothetical protein
MFPEKILVAPLFLSDRVNGNNKGESGHVFETYFLSS